MQLDLHLRLHSSLEQVFHMISQRGSQMSYAIWFATCKCPQPGKNATQSPRAWAWGNLWQTLETAKTIMIIMTTSLMTMTMMMMRKTRLKCFLHNFFSIQQKWTSAGLQSICTSTVTQWQCPLFPLPLACSTITPTTQSQYFALPC